MGINLPIHIAILSIPQYPDNIVSWLKYSIVVSLVIPTVASWPNRPLSSVLLCKTGLTEDPANKRERGPLLRSIYSKSRCHQQRGQPPSITAGVFFCGGWWVRGLQAATVRSHLTLTCHRRQMFPQQDHLHGGHIVFVVVWAWGTGINAFFFLLFYLKPSISSKAHKNTHRKSISHIASWRRLVTFRSLLVILTWHLLHSPFMRWEMTSGGGCPYSEATLKLLCRHAEELFFCFPARATFSSVTLQQ